MKITLCIFASLLFLIPARAEIVDGKIVPSDTVTNAPSHYPHHGIERDKHGRIARSSAARAMFKKLSGYPNGRPGYQIDHTIPLKRGGPDCVCNMRWMTICDKHAKDRVE